MIGKEKSNPILQIWWHHRKQIFFRLHGTTFSLPLRPHFEVWLHASPTIFSHYEGSSVAASAFSTDRWKACWQFVKAFWVSLMAINSKKSYWHTHWSEAQRLMYSVACIVWRPDIMGSRAAISWCHCAFSIFKCSLSHAIRNYFTAQPMQFSVK